MKTKNKLFTAATLTFAAGSIVAGSFVTSNAMASTAEPKTATLTAISPDPSGSGMISCTYTDIPLTGSIGAVQVGPGVAGITSGSIKVDGPTALTTGGVPGDAVAEAGTAVFSATSDGSIPPGAVISPDGSIPPGASIVTKHAGGVDDGTTLTLVGNDGSIPANLQAALDTPSNARPGTAEECAALKPVTGPAPTP